MRITSQNNNGYNFLTFFIVGAQTQMGREKLLVRVMILQAQGCLASKRNKINIISYEEPNLSPDSSLDEPSLEERRTGSSGDMDQGDMNLLIVVRKGTREICILL